jgi:hypothetical protein
MATVGPDQAGLDSYVDPDEPSMGGSVAGVKATIRLSYPSSRMRKNGILGEFSFAMRFVYWA